MDVVAGRAAHLRRRTIAFTPLKQSHLVAVNIRMLYVGRWELLEIFTRAAGPEDKRKSALRASRLNSVVAFGAQINLPVARKLCRIQNVVCSGILRHGSMLHFLSNMTRAGTMTTLARYPRLSGSPGHIGWLPDRRKEPVYMWRGIPGRRDYGTGKLCGAVDIAWAVDPSMPVAPIAHR